MNSGHLTRLRRAFLILSALTFVWAIGVALTGGFVLRLATMRVLSSRHPRNSAIFALLSGLGAWALSTPDERRRALPAVWMYITRALRAAWRYIERGILAPLGFARRLPPQVAPLVAAIAAVAVVTVGLLRGTFVAGGSDAYGYVSEAHLWATGTLRVEQPFVRDMRWPLAREALAPLGYRATPSGTTIVPIYSPGLPLLMAVFERLAGREAVFYVVPLLGGLSVWATYLMGARLAGRMVGVSAAVLLATSPTFLIQLMVPMSDVPVAAWWALALALLLAEGRAAALAAGFAAGAAILTRPNLVPLAVIPGALLVWRAVRERAVTGPAAQRALLFAAGVIPACIAVAIINARLYGSPLASGYGTFDYLYGWNNLWPNLGRYPRWLLDTQTPIVLLALVAPFWVTERGHEGRFSGESRAVAMTWLGFIAAVFICYLFYEPFDAWFWLRFILPAFPPLFVLTSVGLVVTLARLERGVRVLAMAAIVGLLAWHGVGYGLDRGVFNAREGERKAVAIGEYIARKLPERAVLLSMQQSGSIRYYSGRLTVRYDAIPPNWLDAAIEDLRRGGYHPYIVLEEWEEAQFLARFRGQSALAALDWLPVAWLDHSTKVRIYDPAERQALAPDRRIDSEIIH